jgi:predicted nucleic acid-binding Zn ribbon protein
LGRALQSLLRRWGIDGKVRERQAASLWNQVVGQRIAGRTEVLRVEDGKIFVLVNSSSWRTELVFMKPKIVQRLNQAVGRRVIEDIVFLSGGGSAKLSSQAMDEGDP